MFLIVDLEEIFRTGRLGMLKISQYNKFHMPGSSSALFIVIMPKTTENYT